MLRRKVKSNDIGADCAPAANGQLYERIASRAYELFEMRGAGPGDELADWLTAERDVLARTSGLKAQADDGIGNEQPAPPEPRKKSKLMLIGGSRKKAGSTAPRSPAKPKSVRP
jgi:hypothetical protein